MSSPFALFVTCPKGLEFLLAQELTQLGGLNVGQTVAGVKATGDLAVAYRACLWSRLANKVLLSLGKCPANDREALYQGLLAYDWALHLRPEARLWIEVSGTTPALRNTQFTGQIVKDAIVDQLRSRAGQRPSIDRECPDLIVNVRLNRDQASINIDLCGDSLHKRGYRQQSVTAPLKENLAAALLLRAGWPKMLANGCHLLDPLCGSGTLLIEAAMMATDKAPGLSREQFAFERWVQHDTEIWSTLKQEAQQRWEEGLSKSYPEIRGYDADGRAVAASRANAEAAGLDNFIRVIHKPLSDFTRPTHKEFSRGLVITNPPYGERLGERQALLPIYGQLGDILKQQFGGWQAAVFSGNAELSSAIGLRSHKRYQFYNGTIASELLLFDIFHHDQLASAENGENGKAEEHKKTKEQENKTAIELSEGAKMVTNRLQKNLRQLSVWAQQRGINCYRVYDADLPEYAAAIDLYGDKCHVQEYQAPKSVDRQKAQQRLGELVDAVQEVFNVQKTDISVKQRQRQRGKAQYQPLQKKLGGDSFQRPSVSTEATAQWIVVTEGRAQFAVDLWSYLDTGLFLDHRLVREKFAELAVGKKVLNLFCYTATATVQAALAGAKKSISVDMSKTYLQWARKNFELNNISRQHQLVQSDCLQWLQQCREGFDVILLDPPSFSNSKRMEKVLDVQRDHVSLIKRCLDLLLPGGSLLFSTNLRRFQFDSDAFANGNVSICDISQATIDRDFQRKPKIHQCFLIKHTTH